MNQHKTDACKVCEEVRVIAAHGLCYRCYRRAKRAASSHPVKGVNQQISAWLASLPKRRGLELRTLPKMYDRAEIDDVCDFVEDHYWDDLVRITSQLLGRTESPDDEEWYETWATVHTALLDIVYGCERKRA